MKRIFTLLLALVLTFSMAACGTSTDSSDSNSNSSLSTEVGAKSFKYGFISWGTADEHGRTLNAACEWAVNAAGGEFIMDGSATTAETTIAAAENLIQAGCDIISFCTYAGEASVAQISNLCQENEVYWTMWDTTIADSSVQALIDADPYFIGTANEDQYQAGYDTMKELIDQGAKDVIIVKYGVNIPTCDLRCDGAYAAIEEAEGVTVQYEIVMDTSGTDYKKAAQDALVAYPDTDCFFLAGSGQQVPAVASALNESGRDPEDYFIGAFDYYDSMGESFKNGELNIINGGHMVTSTFSALMGINALFGTPLSNEKYEITIPYLTLTNYDEYELYLEYASEGAAYNDAEMKEFIGVYNESLDLAKFQEMVSKWSIADIKARKEG